MEVYLHKDLKTHNTYLLLHALCLNQSATMLDLVKQTGLSQSSVRNMLRDLESHKIIKDIGVDQSTGGRCPNRFIFNNQLLKSLHIYIHQQSVDFQRYDSDEIKVGHIKFVNYDELIDWIQNQVISYDLQYITIAVKGVVNEYSYYTDHQDDYVKNDWIYELRKNVHIPIYIENDVKIMQRGIYSENEMINDFTYLYINEVGMACSTMKEGHIVSGHQGIIGELGLLPYHDITINQAIRDCQNQKEFSEIIAYLCMVICVSIDPQKIIIVSDKFDININEIKEKIKQSIYHQYDIENIKNAHSYLFKGLHALGIQKTLMKISEER